MARKPSTRLQQKLFAQVAAYLADPNNDRLEWTWISENICKKRPEYLQTTLTAEHRKELWRYALEIRRDFYAINLSEVDKALFEKAVSGDVAAIKLAYQRFEGWVPTEKKEIEEHTQNVIVYLPDNGRGMIEDNTPPILTVEAIKAD